MNKIIIYKESAKSPSKENNLARRAEIFAKHYIPYLKELGIFTEGSNCLELGCGQGHKGEKLINNFPDINYSGIDKSEIMLGKATKRLSEYKLSLCDITNMTEIGDNSQDIICLFQVLHHLDLDNRTKAHSEINRILRSNGYVVTIITPTFQSNKIKQILLDTSYRFYAVLSQYPDISLRKRINEAILSIIFPSKYRAEDYGYHDINFDNMFGVKNEFKLIQSVTPKVLYNTISCISDMHVFQKA